MFTVHTASSEAINKFTYDFDRLELHVAFSRGGLTYTYIGVPPRVVAGFVDAKSKGQFFNRFIRPVFKYRIGTVDCGTTPREV